MLQDADGHPDVVPTIQSVARTLRPGGWFIFHPCYNTPLSEETPRRWGWTRWSACNWIAPTGIALNPNVLDYKLPTIKDLPAHIETFYVEAPKARGVFGAQGVGEPPISAPAPPSPARSTTPWVCGSRVCRSRYRRSLPRRDGAEGTDTLAVIRAS